MCRRRRRLLLSGEKGGEAVPDDPYSPSSSSSKESWSNAGLGDACGRSGGEVMGENEANGGGSDKSGGDGEGG